MAQHGLIKRGWSFAFNRRKRSLGICNYTAKRVELSQYFIDRNDPSSIRDTLLHEIAHALVGRRSAHGPAWVDACRRIGAIPSRTCSTAIMPQGLFQAKCPTCGMCHDRHRRPSKKSTYYCRSCGPEDGKLRFLLEQLA